MKNLVLTALLVTLATAHTFLCPDDYNKDFNKVLNSTTYTYHVYCDGNIIGTDLRRFSTGSFDACVQACANDGVNCVGASWVSMTRGCILKSTVEDPDAYAPGVSTVIRL